MKETVYFLCPPEIARRAGIAKSGYVTRDGRYIATDYILANVRFTADEILNGLDVERITREEAVRLEKENKYATGLTVSLSENQEEEEVNNE